MGRTSKVLGDQGPEILGVLPLSQNEDRGNLDSRKAVADDHSADRSRYREREDRLASDRGDERVQHGL